MAKQRRNTGSECSLDDCQVSNRRFFPRVQGVSLLVQFRPRLPPPAASPDSRPTTQTKPPHLPRLSLTPSTHLALCSSQKLQRSFDFCICQLVAPSRATSIVGIFDCHSFNPPLHSSPASFLRPGLFPRCCFSYLHRSPLLPSLDSFSTFDDLNDTSSAPSEACHCFCTAPVTRDRRLSLDDTIFPPARELLI